MTCIWEWLVTLILFAGLISCQSSSKKQVQASDDEDQELELSIEYIGHASFLLEHDGHTLLLDPFADSVWISYLFPRDVNADAIFSTHPHYDHDGGIFRDLKPYWQGTMPFHQDVGVYDSGPFHVTGIKGKHCDPYGKEFGQKNTIFIFDVADLRIVHWGDNGPLNDTLAAALTNVDILLLPIDDTYHILKEDETKEVIDRLNPRLIIPMHYRIDELEPTIGKPKNLGGIAEYFKGRKNVTWLDNHKYSLTKDDLPSGQEYLVFRHSPEVIAVD